MSLSSVKRVWPLSVYSLPKDEVVWTGKTTDGAQSITKRQDSNSTDTFSPHVMTQVDQLRAQGILGTGIKVGIIDTGVDYNHPALGGCFGSGCLVSYGTDLVGDDYTGYNVPVPDEEYAAFSPLDCAFCSRFWLTIFAVPGMAAKAMAPTYPASSPHSLAGTSWTLLEPHQ